MAMVLTAQDHVSERQEAAFNKNTIFGSAGLGVYAGSITGYYERLLWHGNKSSMYARGGYGTSAGGWGDGYAVSYGLIQTAVLFGGKNSHLELAFGAVMDLGGDKGNISGEFPLSGSVNYRFQKPKGPFIFRTGVGWPELLFIGTGIAF